MWRAVIAVCGVLAIAAAQAQADRSTQPQAVARESTLVVPAAGDACVYDPVTVTWTSNELPASTADARHGSHAGHGAWVGLFHAPASASVCRQQSPFSVLGLGTVTGRGAAATGTDTTPSHEAAARSVLGAEEEAAGGSVPGGDAGVGQQASGPLQRLRCLLDPLFCTLRPSSLRVFYYDKDEGQADAPEASASSSRPTRDHEVLLNAAGDLAVPPASDVSPLKVDGQAYNDTVSSSVAEGDGNVGDGRAAGFSLECGAGCHFQTQLTINTDTNRFATAVVALSVHRRAVLTDVVAL